MFPLYWLSFFDICLASEGLSDVVNRRRTENRIAKGGKKTKEKTMVHKTTNR
jgi:hypothetical protein